MITFLDDGRYPSKTLPSHPPPQTKALAAAAAAAGAAAARAAHHSGPQRPSPEKAAEEAGKAVSGDGNGAGRW